MADEFKEILNVMRDHPEITSSIEDSKRDEFIKFLEIMHSFSSITAGIEPQRQAIIQNFLRAKSASIPINLYHYTGLQGVSGILQSNSLWATNYRNLNDASELIYGADLLVDELEKFSAGTSGDNSIFLNKIAGMYREHGDKMRDFMETYIISLSESGDMLSQWRAYADQAQGYCIEFKFNDSGLFTIIGNNAPWALEILPVIYDPTTQRGLVREGITKVITYLDSTPWTIKKIVNSPETEQASILGLIMHVFQPFIISFKHPGFSEEKEWRAITSCARNLTENCKKKKQSGGGIGYYLDCIFIQGDKERLWQRRFLPISNISLGPLAKGDAKQNLLKIIQTHGYESLIKISKSTIPLK